MASDSSSKDKAANNLAASKDNSADLADAWCDAHGEPDPARAPRLLEHEGAQAVLRRAHAAGRLHHAWMLAGPRGIGKACLAWAWARFLLHYGDDAATAAELSADGVGVPPDSRAVARLQAGAHTDFLHVHPDWDARTRIYREQLPASALRRIAPLFALSAAEQRGWRVCLIDSADAMTPTAANALLKILEEPPPRALFLIVCHQPGRVLPTIRSRCQLVPMRKLRTASVAQILKLHLPAMAEAERLACAQLGEGSAHQALGFARTRGMQVYAQTLQILQRLPHLPWEEVHKLADELAQTGASHAAPRFARFADLLLGIVHRAASVLAGGQADALPQERPLVEQWRSSLAIERLADVWAQMAALAERNTGLRLDGRQSVLAYFTMLAQSFHKQQSS